MASLKVLCFFFISVALVNNAQGFGRIVGGIETTIQKRPYQVSLQNLNDDYYTHGCGASIISTKYLLSAAHCKPANLTTYYARVGATKYSTGGEVYKVDKFIPHPQYNGNNLDYDVAIVTLLPGVEITLSADVKVISLTSGSNPNVGSLVTVSGWGATMEAGSSWPTLKEVDLPTVEDSVCKRTYPNLTDRQICFGGTPQGMQSSCFGDSGGPAVQNGVQYGIVSGGNSCELPNIPGIYVRISSVRTWITEQSGV